MLTEISKEQALQMVVIRERAIKRASANLAYALSKGWLNSVANYAREIVEYADDCRTFQRVADGQTVNGYKLSVA